MADKSTRDELERLVAGEAIEKHIRLELTYDEIDSSIDNLWSVLFTTGYLTQKGVTEDGAYKLVIPNQEIREVYKLQIQEWFKKKVFADTGQGCGKRKFLSHAFGRLAGRKGRLAGAL